MDLGMPELMIILVLVVLLFGVGRIGKIAGELGTGVRAFREGLKGDDDLPAPEKKVEAAEATSAEAKPASVEAEKEPASVEHLP